MRTVDGGQTILQVAGRLQAVDVSVLDREVAAVAGSLVLDLSQLLSADGAGIKELRDCKAGGADLQGASGYVQMLLDDRLGAGRTEV